MNAFKYVVQDTYGKTIKGVARAEDRSGLIEVLRERKYRVLSIEPATQLDFLFFQLQDILSGVRRENVIYFTRQLSTLVRSGLPLPKALESLAWQERNPKFKAIIETIKNDIEKGRSFKDAISKFPHLFSNLYTGMIESGEAAGILDDVLERLAQIGMQELDIRTKVQSAFTYPIILLCVAFFVVGFLLIGAVPKFLDIFRASNSELPFITMILLNTSTFFRQFWFLIIVLTVTGIVLLNGFYRTEKGRTFFDGVILRIPVFGELYTKIVIARFTRTVSALTKSGIPILRALDISKSILNNVIMKAAVEQIRIGVSQGKDLAELFQKAVIFPPMVVQMVSVGENTGKLDEMLGEVAKFYETELEYTLRNLSSSLEPLLLLFMGFVVGFIALAVLMPVFNLVKVFKQ